MSFKEWALYLAVGTLLTFIVVGGLISCAKMGPIGGDFG